MPLDSQAFLSVLRNVSTLRDVFADPPMFTIVVHVNPTAPVGTIIKNKATLTSPSDLNPHTAETTVTVIGEADLLDHQDRSSDEYGAGGVVTYTLVVRNAGPNAVTGARVFDPVPGILHGVTWTCTASLGSRCPASGIGAIDVLVDLPVGGTVTFTLSATVDPAVQGGPL